MRITASSRGPIPIPENLKYDLYFNQPFSAQKATKYPKRLLRFSRVSGVPIKKNMMAKLARVKIMLARNRLVNKCTAAPTAAAPRPDYIRL